MRTMILLFAAALPFGPALAADTAQRVTPATAEQREPAQPITTPTPRLKTCPPITGSHLRRNATVNCEELDPFVRTYSRDDILGTGETDLSKALFKLDPAIRRH